MMNEIDAALLRLSQDQVPSRLAATEALVLDRITGGSPRSHDASRPFRIAAVAAALMIGILGGLMPGESATAKPSLSPLGGAADLAPSTLLTEGW